MKTRYIFLTILAATLTVSCDKFLDTSLDLNASGETVETNRGTVIASKTNKDVKVGTIEHSMAALYAAGVDNCIIEINAPEMPILDGSATLYSEKIEEVGLKEQAGVAPVVLRPAQPVWTDLRYRHPR